MPNWQHKKETGIYRIPCNFVEKRKKKWNISAEQNTSDHFITTFCSGGPVSLDFLFHKSWMPFELLFSWSKLFEFSNLSLRHLGPLFFLKKFESEFFWCWAIEECRLKADKTSSDVFLISDPKTQESHCFNHKRTCSKKTIQS